MDPSDLPPDVRLAEECSAALDRGDLDAARQLAEHGLQLATAKRSAKWARRFQHLLNMCAPHTPESSAEEPIVCSFCQGQSLGARQIVAGPSVSICRGCVAACVEGSRGSTIIQRLHLHGVRCSFCSRPTDSDPSVYGARENYICVECVDLCVDIFGDSRAWREVP